MELTDGNVNSINKARGEKRTSGILKVTIICFQCNIKCLLSTVLCTTLKPKFIANFVVTLSDRIWVYGATTEYLAIFKEL